MKCVGDGGGVGVGVREGGPASVGDEGVAGGSGWNETVDDLRWWKVVMVEADVTE